MKIKNLIFGSPIPNAKQQEQKNRLVCWFCNTFFKCTIFCVVATGEVFIVLATAGAVAVM